jgi:hypothetical protein
VDVPEKYVVTFKPGKEMEERVLQLQEAAQANRVPPVKLSVTGGAHDDEATSEDDASAEVM